VTRTRVHNLFVSLDGYAAGDHVTFDAPIGDAGKLFGTFDGRVIHGIDRTDDAITLDRALTTMWGQGGSVPRSWAAGSSGHRSVIGPRTAGGGGGGTSHRS